MQLLLLLLPGFTTNPLILSKDQVPCTLASFRTLVEKVRYQIHNISMHTISCCEQRAITDLIKQPPIPAYHICCHCYSTMMLTPPLLLPLLLPNTPQARQMQAQELQIQAWGGSAAAMEAAALRVLDLDPGLITVSHRAL